MTREKQRGRTTTGAGLTDAAGFMLYADAAAVTPLAGSSLMARRALGQSLSPAVLAFRDDIQERFGSELEAIVLYGSWQFPELCSPSSRPDFFVLLNSYRQAYRQPGLALLNWILPPNVFALQLSQAGRCKMSVITLRDLERETGPAARDVYHLGRFSKSFTLVYARDLAVRARVIALGLSAVRQAIAAALLLLPEVFTLEELIVTAFSVSYRGEARPEPPNRACALFHADREHYEALYGQVLEAYVREAALSLTKSPGGQLQVRPPPSPAQRAALEAMLRRSRWRSHLRLAKGVLTFDDWLDYALDKVQRMSGARPKLTERQRRHPLLFAWGHLIRLRRQGALR